MMRLSSSPVFLALSLLLPACSLGVETTGGYSQPPPNGTEAGDDGGTSTGDDSGADSGGNTGDDADPDEGGETEDEGGETEDEGGETEDEGDSGDTGEDSGDEGEDSGGTEEDSGGAEEDSGGADSGSGDSGGTDPEPCQVSDNEVTPVPPNIMLVLDKSGSMYIETWDHDQDATTAEVTRWNTLHGAVSRLTMNFEDRVKFGAKLYPEFNATGFGDAACAVAPGVEVPCALNNGANVVGGIPLAGAMVQGATPTQSGLSEGITYLQGLPAEEPKVALLIADGAISETCAGETFAGAVTLVTDAATGGIPTYVIGIDPEADDPNSTNDTFDQLTALAQAGGTVNPNGPPDFFPVQNEADLDAVMEQIISESLQCIVNIDPVPEHPDLFQVWVGANQVPLITDCATEVGWHWTVEFSQIEFCNMACVDLNTVGSMEGKYFCPPS